MRLQWIASDPRRQWARQPQPKPSTQPASLTVRSDARQVWEGFGGCFNELGWIALAALSRADRERALRALFSTEAGCGFSRCRLPIGASDYAAEWYSLNETPDDLAMRHFNIGRDREFLIPYIRAAQHWATDLTLFASPWSPPTWMKQPRAYNYGTLIWTPPILKAYALYFVRFVQAYAREGIPIHQVHPQNEPVADQKFPSCKWTGAQLRDFIRDYLGPAFRRHGLKCEIWLGTLNTADYHGFVHQVLVDPRARRFITGVGLQWDGKGAIQRTRQAWPDMRLMQTENECGDGKNTWAYAHYVFELLHHYITNGAHAYVYWNMVLPAGGRSTWGWLQNAMLSVDTDRHRLHFNPEFFLMQHVARWVQPGAVVLDVAGPWAGHALAFRNADGRQVCIVHNPAEVPQTLRVSLSGTTHELHLAPQSFNTLAAGG